MFALQTKRCWSSLEVIGEIRYTAGTAVIARVDLCGNQCCSEAVFVISLSIDDLQFVPTISISSKTMSTPRCWLER